MHGIWNKLNASKSCSLISQGGRRRSASPDKKRARDPGVLKLFRTKASPFPELLRRWETQKGPKGSEIHHLIHRCIYIYHLIYKVYHHRNDLHNDNDDQFVAIRAGSQC